MARSGSHVAPDSPDGWVDMARRELGNMRGAYEGKLSNDAKIGHALLATEFALKACLWKTHKWTKWPNRTKPHLYLYRHDLDAMLSECGFLRHALLASVERGTSWKVLLNAAAKQARYSPHSIPDAEANDVVKSARHPDKGVVQWLLERYRMLT